MNICKMSQTNWAVVGTFIHATDDDPMVVLCNHCIGINDGKISFIEKANKGLHEILRQYDIKEEDVLYLKESQFIIPGFIDTHLHAPQYPNCANGVDEELFPWLQKFTFPLEAKYTECNKFAKESYDKLLSKLVRNGTTTACYYGTISTDDTLALCDVIEKHGQRAIVGKVSMVRNSPENYCESSEECITEVERFITTLMKRQVDAQNSKIQPCITPRSGVSCTMGIMKRLANLAHSNDLHIQTHSCETQSGCEHMQKLYPDCNSCLDIYDKAGLLTRKTVLAHGIYLNDEDIGVLVKRQSGISHCPNSNILLKSGFLDAKRLLKYNVPVGLGTDISAGYSPSILNAMRFAITTSKTVSMHSGNTDKALNYKDVFRMATHYGSKVLAMEDNIGNFKVGKEFDALLIDVSSPGSMIDVFTDETAEDFFRKFIFLGDDRNILSVFVAGENILKC